jgi:hypothetical protein
MTLNATLHLSPMTQSCIGIFYQRNTSLPPLGLRLQNNRCHHYRIRQIEVPKLRLRAKWVLENWPFQWNFIKFSRTQAFRSVLNVCPMESLGDFSTRKCLWACSTRTCSSNMRTTIRSCAKSMVSQSVTEYRSPFLHSLLVSNKNIGCPFSGWGFKRVRKSRMHDSLIPLYTLTNKVLCVLTQLLDTSRIGSQLVSPWSKSDYQH